MGRGEIDAMGAYPAGLGPRSALQDWVRFLRRESHLLRERPSLFFQQAADQPRATSPSHAAASWFRARHERRPWLQWRNRPRDRSACLMVLIGHTDRVNACAFAPDGSRLVSGSRDETLKLWDARWHQELHTLAGHTAQVAACAFSPDGFRIASVTGDGTPRLWDVNAGVEEYRYPLEDPGCVLAWGPDGRQLAIGAWGGSLYMLALENFPSGALGALPAYRE